MWKLRISITLLLPILVFGHLACVHHEFSRNATKHFYHDLGRERVMAADVVGK